MRTICKGKYELDRANDAPWAITLMYSQDGGRSFRSGETRRFGDDREGHEAMRAWVNGHCTTLRVFPLITKQRQRDFEAACLAGTLELPESCRWGRAMAMETVPTLCGYYGRACCQMDDDEGANRALCMGCPLAEYACGVEMMEYAKGE